MKQDSVEAKVVETKEGHNVMYMKGEKYPFPGYPREVLLYGKLSPLKHHIKNQIFNEAWHRIDKDSPEEVMQYLRGTAWPNIVKLAQETTFDMVPYQKMVPIVKELYRAFTAVYAKTGNKHVLELRDVMTFILQEDDAYRFRFQWLAKFFNPNSLWRKVLRRDPIKDFDWALSMLEHGEMIGDMKERQRLLRKVLVFVLKDESVRNLFQLFQKELDWKKVQLSKADKYFFRAKYFKVDYPERTY